MANAPFTDHSSQICFTLLAFWRCTLGESSNLGGGLTHLLIVRGVWCRDLRPSSTIILLADHRVIEAEGLVGCGRSPNPASHLQQVGRLLLLDVLVPGTPPEFAGA